MVTRVEGDDWIVLEAEDHGYGVEPPTLFRWTDSFCSRMVSGEGPRIAPSSAEVPAYAEAPLGLKIPIGAYIGVPLTWPDGTLFGTLCAIDPLPRPQEITAELPFVEFMGRILSEQLWKDLMIAELVRKAERARIDAETDALTGLFNRRAWDKLLAIEEERCRRYGHPACILSLDINGLKAVNDTSGHEAGDRLIRKAAEVLVANFREQDVVARVGGDEFAVLMTEGRAKGEVCPATQIRLALDKAGVAAAVGSETRLIEGGLEQAWRNADARMYEDKQLSKDQLQRTEPRIPVAVSGSPEPVPLP